MNAGFVLHQTLFGAIAAAGFAVLFNVAFRQLPWCVLIGAVALCFRTVCQELGMSLVGASFAAALAVGVAAQLRRAHGNSPQDVLDVVGCIPLVPGSLASKALLALYAITTGAVEESRQLLDAAQYTLGVAFTIGGIGTGVVIPMLLFRRWRSRSVV